MKITLTPTETESISSHRTVSVELAGDDQTLADMMNDLVISALLASGYSQELIDEYFKS